MQKNTTNDRISFNMNSTFYTFSTIRVIVTQGKCIQCNLTERSLTLANKNLKRHQPALLCIVILCNLISCHSLQLLCVEYKSQSLDCCRNSRIAQPLLNSTIIVTSMFLCSIMVFGTSQTLRYHVIYIANRTGSRHDYITKNYIQYEDMPISRLYIVLQIGLDPSNLPHTNYTQTEVARTDR